MSRARLECQSPISMKFGISVVFEKIFDVRVFFLYRQSSMSKG